MENIDYIDEVDTLEEKISEEIQMLIPITFRGERIDKTLAQLLPDFSRSRIKQWLDRGLITRNDQVLTAKSSAFGNETILLKIPEDPQNLAFSPENIPLEVVFEDADIAVINKPPGMVVHPAAGNWTGTMLNGLLFHIPECAQVPRAGIVHRLDKDTSGLLVVAKTLQAQTNLVRQLQERSVNRRYFALVWGEFSNSTTINAPIGRDPRDRLKMGVVRNSSGKPAITHITPLGEISLDKAIISLLACKLETGRTHQIRVHLESIGHPLLNDPIYKKKVPIQAFQKLKEQFSIETAMPGQALHAAVLGFNHPVSGKYMSWSAEPPVGYLTFLRETGFEDESWSQIFE